MHIILVGYFMNLSIDTVDIYSSKAVQIRYNFAPTIYSIICSSMHYIWQFNNSYSVVLDLNYCLLVYSAVCVLSIYPCSIKLTHNNVMIFVHNVEINNI